MGGDDRDWTDDVSDAEAEGAVREAMDKLRALRGGVDPRVDAGWAPFVDALDVEASPATPPCVLPGFAWRGRLSIVSGPPKAGKSTAIAQAIGCRLRGEAFASGRVVPAGPVAIVTEEPLGLLAQRLRAYGVGDAHDGAVWLASPEDGADRVLAALARSAPEVLVVDSFTPWALAAGAESLSDPAGMRRVMDALRRVADGGAGVVVVHHGRRSDGELADSRDLSAAVDMVIGFHPVDSAGRRTELGASALRKLSYLGRWPQDSVTAEYRAARYVVDDGAASECVDGVR